MSAALFFVVMALGMAAVTTAIKLSMFALGHRVTLPPLLHDALAFVPVTVLTTIIVPMIVSPHGRGLELTLKNPQLIASLAAIVAAVLFRRQLVTIATALVVFFAWKHGMLR